MGAWQLQLAVIFLGPFLRSFCQFSSGMHCPAGWALQSWSVVVMSGYSVCNSICVGAICHPTSISPVRSFNAVSLWGGVHCDSNWGSKTNDGYQLNFHQWKWVFKISCDPSILPTTHSREKLIGLVGCCRTCPGGEHLHDGTWLRLINAKPAQINKQLTDEMHNNAFAFVV